MLRLPIAIQRRKSQLNKRKNRFLRTLNLEKFENRSLLAGDSFLITSPGEGLETLTGNLPSQAASLSRDGNVVVFTSQATNLVEGDTGGRLDIFARDLTTGVTERISVSSSEVEANSDSSVFNGAIDYADVSADGRYVVFVSSASNLASDANFRTDIFRRDRQLGMTELVSASPTGVAADADSAHPAISSDGSKVLFRSRASNLVSGITGGFYQIFLKDMTTGSVTLISQASAIANSDSEDPTFSDDGRYVFFKSSASNLVAGDTNGYSDFFRKDLVTGTVIRVNTGSAGQQATFNSNSNTDHIVSSRDGRYAAFMMQSSNLGYGIFRKDLDTGTLLHITTGDSGGESFGASISGDGDAIAFGSTKSRLPADTNSFTDYYRYQISTNSLALISVNSLGNIGSYHPNIPTGFNGHTSISDDGLRVAFSSTVAGLISNDYNIASDVFLVDREILATSAISIVPPTLVSSTGSGADTFGTIYLSGQSSSYDARYIAFASYRSDLVDGDTNGSNDVFRHDRTTGETVRVNLTASGAQTSGFADSPAITPDGRYVAFKTTVSFDPRDTQNYDIYVKDLESGSIRLVTIPSSIPDQDRGQSCDNPSISGLDADGNFYVVWHTHRKMSADDTSVYSDIYRWYSGDNRVELVSKNADGVVGNHYSINNETGAQISADGRYVAFASSASNLVPNDTNLTEDVFVKDMQTGEIVRASVDAAGNQFQYSSNVFAFSRYPAISGDGKSVSFTTYINGTYSHFVRNLETNVLTLANTSLGGVRSNVSGTFNQLSHDGRYVAFLDNASISPGPWPGSTPGVHVKDLQTGLVVRTDTRSEVLPVANSGLASSWPFTMSPDGRTITFRTTDSKFIAKDFNATTDIFSRRWEAPPTTGRDTYYTKINTILSQGTQGGVLSNDTPGVLGIVAAVLQTAPTSGTLTFNANGSFNYVPANNFTGEVWFSYWATDGLGYSEPRRATIYVEPNSADLAIAMAATVDNASVGQEVSYAIQFVNLGPTPATGTVVTWQLPSNAEFVSATGSYTQTGGLFSWSVGDLAQGSKGRLDVVARITSPGSTGTIARVTGTIPDYVPGNNSVCTSAPADLRNWWRAENSTLDQQGSVITSLENEADYSRGYIGEGFTLDGVNDTVLTESINLGSAYTVEFWVRPTRSVGYEHLISNGFNNANFGAIYFRDNRIEYFQGGTGRVTTPANSVPLNTWSHIALTYDGSRTQLYFNGALLGTSANHTAPFNNALRFGYAVTADSSSRFRGKLDEIALYGRSLSSQEIAAIFTQTKCFVGLAPTAPALSSNSVNENKASGAVVGTLSSIDADAVDAHVFQLISGAGDEDNSQFEVRGTSLVTKVKPDYEAKSSYRVRLRVRDSAGNTTDVPTTIAVNDLLEVERSIVGDGTAQRSLVQTLEVRFDNLVTIEGNAFQVTRKAGNALPAGNVAISTSTRTVNNKTIVTLTFSGAMTRDAFGTLIDGYYQLQIDGSKIRTIDTESYLDGDRNGDIGGLYQFGNQQTDLFFAYFGDLDGDGFVGTDDFNKFKLAYGKSSTQTGYRRELDYLGVGLVRVFDFNEFRKRQGKTLSF